MFLVEGVILVYDREARSNVVKAFKRAGWRPAPKISESQRASLLSRDDPGAIDRVLYETRGYRYLSRSECNGDTPRYVTSGTRAEVDKLSHVLDEMKHDGTGGFDAYLEG